MSMMVEDFNTTEQKVFELLEGKLSNVHTYDDIFKTVEKVVKTVRADATRDEIRKMVDDARTFEPINKYLFEQEIEDIMVNNTKNVFVYHSSTGNVEVPEKIGSRDELNNFVRKLRMYATSSQANRHIYDVHLPNGSRVNIVDSPMGQNVTVRNFKQHAYSMIDLINLGELSYELAARLWLYAEGLEVRPANLMIGGMPGSGKTTLLNSMFSFFRPEARVVVIEETYELNTETQENCVRLETSPEVNMEQLLENVLRMRPDMIIIGETRGIEARTMMTAMNIGKIVMSTIHASNARDIVTRLQHDPMNIDMNIIPLIDSFVVSSQVNEHGKRTRRVTQVSETSGIETQILLSDVYSYDYRLHRGSTTAPSITYRDTLAKLSGYSPTQIMEEERRRAAILEKMNRLGIKELHAINEFCRDYYDDPMSALRKIGLEQLGSLY